MSRPILLEPFASDASLEISSIQHADGYTQCMSHSTDTTIRLSAALRDRIKEAAAKRGVKQSTVIELGLRELEQSEFLRSVAAVEWDDEAAAEADEWEDADLTGPFDPWDAN